MTEGRGLRLGCAAAGALAFSLACTLPMFVQGTASLAACLIGSLPIACFTAGVLYYLPSLANRCVRDPRSGSLSMKVFVAILVLLLLVWICFFLVLYPGICTNDSVDVINMVSGGDFSSNTFRYAAFNSHHPPLYSLLCWIVMEVGGIAGLGTTASIAVLSLVHLIFLALCCAYVAARLFALSGSRGALVLSSAFFALNPLMGFYSVTIWKDVIFAAIFAVFVIELISLLFDAQRYVLDRRRLVLFVVSALAASLLRSNGFVAVALAIVAAVLAVSKGARRRIAFCGTVVLVSFVIVTRALYPLLGIVPAHAAESMAVPIQQIACTIKHGGAMTSDQETFIGDIMPLSEWGSSYAPGVVDKLKFREDFDDAFLEEHKSEFVATWLAIGIRNPRCYFEAWCAQTLNYWSFDSETWYVAPAGYSLDERERVASNKLSGVLNESQLAAYLDAFQRGFPYFFNMGQLAWFVIAVVGVLLSLRRWRAACCLVPLLAYWATYLVAAPASDFRYIFPMMLCVPIVVYLLVWRLPSDLPMPSRNAKGRHGSSVVKADSCEARQSGEGRESDIMEERAIVAKPMGEV